MTVKQMAHDRLRVDHRAGRSTRINWRMEAVPAPWIAPGHFRVSIIEYTDGYAWERAWFAAASKAEAIASMGYLTELGAP